MKDKNRELSQTDHIKSHSSANISNELRSPKTIVSAPLRIILEEEFTERSKYNIESVPQNTVKLCVLVEEILALSKLRSEEIVAQPFVINIYPLLRRIMDGFIELSKHKLITYRLELTELPDDYLLLDAHLLEKIISHLLSNALKHTPEGGEVVLRVELKGNQLCVSVKDSGSGISPEDLPHVFDRYFQVNQPDIPIQVGTDMGLALAKEYSRLMGGRCEVESVLGQGSVFLVRLPYVVSDLSSHYHELQLLNAAKEEAKLKVLTPDNPFGPTERLKVLVVENNPEMQALVKYIQKSKCEVRIAIHGQEALDIIRNESIDLVISGAMMSKVDGFELLKRLSEDGKYLNLPVILLKALNHTTFRLEALHIGADDYLFRPFSPNELKARVADMIGRHQVRPPTLEKTEGDKSSENGRVTLGRGTKNDNLFIVLVEELITAQLENEDFSFESASDHFQLSERNFRNKVKRITGLSPKKYQREVALQKARELLEGHIYDNLTAVAYSVGIRNATRFAQYYEMRFGQDPREFFSAPY